MSRIVGIDLGTSTSEIAVLKDGKPYVIPNRNGSHITPSVVGVLEDGSIIVGEQAKEQLLLRPQDTVMEIKRLMGTDSKVEMAGKQYSPQEISSFILKYLMDCAKEHLGETVDSAVITVPAYFSDEQRKATVEAGKLAGIRVERIINEPTAASLDYGIDHMEECRNVLVYDLGGGTLDVTVLEMFEGVLEVKASSGNNRLGGKDFDTAVMDYLLEQFVSEHGVDPSEDARAMMRLKEVAEKCKISLSSMEEYRVMLPFFASVGSKPVALEKPVNRETFEALIKDEVESTGRQILSALEDSKLKPTDIDLVLLIGGSTRIPFVASFVERILGKEPQSLVDPDLAVVRGAAVQAAILSNELSSERDIMITDVCPYTLGVSILGFIGGFPDDDVFDVIIPRNITIPTIKEKVYGTVGDSQTAVEVKVFQGEYKKASRNNFLGRFRMEGIPEAPAFEQKIRVSFSYDVNGILSVEGIIASTGEKVRIAVDTTGVDMNCEVDVSGWKDMPDARRFRLLINKAERLLLNEETGGNEMLIDSLVIDIKTGLVTGRPVAELMKLKDELQGLLYDLEEDSDD